MKTIALVSVEGDFPEIKNEGFPAGVSKIGQEKAKNRGR